MKNLALLFTSIAFMCQMPGTRVLAQDNPSTARWEREEKTDPLRGTHYSQFSLQGKFLTPPRNATNTHPFIITQCQAGRDNHGHTNGKFITGYIFVGSVMDTAVSESGASSIPIQFRLDDGKLQSENLGRSTDFSAIFFTSPTCPVCGSGYDVLANLLYGHHMYHKENTNPQVRKVVVGVSEFLGGEIVMQFDMPDATEIAETCGIVWHK